MKNIQLLTLLFATVFAFVVFPTVGWAQGVCPAITLDTPKPVVNAGEDLSFRATVSSGTNIKYFWMLSAGAIRSGQGTSEIKIDTKDLDGYSVTATLEIGGVDPNCPTVKSSTAEVMMSAPTAKKLHQYSAPWPRDEAARVKRIAKYVSNIAGEDMIYVTHFGGKVAKPTAAAADRARLLKLFSANGIAAERVVFVNGDKATRATFVVWHVPSAAMPPAMAAPTAAPAPMARKLDTFTARNESEAPERWTKAVDNFKTDPLSKIHLILNYVPALPPDEAKMVREAVIERLKSSGIDPDSYVIVENRRAREISVEFWLVPLGAQNPGAQTRRTR